jgi:alpha-tubulin suppressor-like RCC1 family protein
MKRIILLSFLILRINVLESQGCWKVITHYNGHNISMKQDSSIWGWGNNVTGCLGICTQTSSSSPVQIGTLRNWTDISCGISFTFAIKEGELWACGANDHGQLGDGTTTNRFCLTKISTSSNWKKIECGAYHTLALKTDGTLWAWGDNLYGELGIGFQNYTPNSTPIQIGTSDDWVSIQAGNYFSMGLKNDGTLWTWGRNDNGQLGQGTNYSNYTPTQVGIDTDWSSIIASKLATAFAFKTNGSLWGWGNNFYGQLGNGNTNNLTTPIQISTEFIRINSGNSHTLGIKTNGTLWAWGRNSGGQLGTGNYTNSLIPIQIGTDSDWLSVTAGYFSSNALKNNLTLWAWGANLGNSSTSGSATPIPIPCPTTAPFPIELQSFTAEHKEKSIALYWTTASEQNNKGFDIQQSSDGKQWNSIAWQEGKGNSAILNNYHFTDPYPIRGINYYRLAQQDYDGTVTYSKIVSVLYESDQKVRIYPNPVSDLLHIDIQDNQEYNLVIYNAHMRKLYDVNSDKPIDLDLSKWSDGLYYVNVSSDQSNITYPVVVRK